MSITVNKSNILFLIFLLKSLNFAPAAPLYYNDYNNYDLYDKDLNDYLENDEPNPTEPVNNGAYYMPGCNPIKYTTTTISPSTTAPCSHITNDIPAPNEYQDVVDHVIKILRSMRRHAVSLIRNMNQLEMNILSSPSSDLEEIYKNSTDALSDNVNGMEKIIYPDMLPQVPNYDVNEWSSPMKVDSTSDSGQTNEFVSEAQKAVKSWKHDIENCKIVLDNAVHNALLQANVKSNFITDSVASTTSHPSPSFDKKLNHSTMSFKQLSRDLINPQKNIQRSRIDNKKYKYHSLYDAFHTKDENY